MVAPGSGLLVTLDGPSGVGKTTVSGLIRDRLATTGVPVVLTTTPSSSSLGELARHGTNEFFGPALACLVAADRYHHDPS
jgi:dTMP kinase